MRRSLVALALGLVLASPALAVPRVQLACNLLAQGQGAVTECGNGGFPYTVPPGFWFCLTDAKLVNKFPWDFQTGRAMYFMLWGVSVPSHAPNHQWLTPLAYPPGFLFQGWISNGMTEAQWVYGLVTGYLSPTEECAR